MTTTQNVKRQLELEWRAVEELRDLIRVQIHLGNMELKDSWSALEPKLASLKDDVQAELKAAGSAIGNGVLETLTSVRQRLIGLTEKLGDRK